MSEHQKQIFILIFLLLIAAGGVAGFWRLINKETEVIANHKATIKEIMSTQDGVIFTTRSIGGEADSSSNLFKYFPALGQEVVTLERLEDLAKEGPVSLSIVSAQPNNEGVTVNLEARGSFPALYHYLRLLEQMDLYLVFEQTDLRQVSEDGEDSGGEWLLESTINIPTIKN